MSLIEVENLSKKHGQKAILRNVNMKVNKGETFALIGPTGTGKTTLLRLLDLLDTPTAGKIYFDGQDTAAPAKTRLKLRRRMGFVLQKPVAFNMTVYENIACGLKWHGRDKHATQRRVNEVLEMVGMISYKDRNAKTLSGGEMQRVAIARAIAVEPELLLLDEPTANLDPVSITKIEEVISNITQHDATTIIMATHDMVHGQRLADRTGVLINGEIQQSGGFSEIFVLPGNRNVAEFVGMENIIETQVTSSREGVVSLDASKQRVIEAAAGYPAGEKVFACIRPENIVLSLNQVSSSARNSFAGKIIALLPEGPLMRIKVDCGFPLVVLVMKQSAEEMELRKEKQVFVSFKATAVHVIKSE